MTTNLNSSNILISLPQMLDLALGTSKVETINLNMLHHFLHIILHLNDLKSMKVEYRGEDANKIKKMISSSFKPEVSPHLHDYIINRIENKNQHNNQSNNKDIKVDVYIDVDSTSNQLEIVQLPKNYKSSIQKLEALNQTKYCDFNKEIESVIFIKPLLDKVSTLSTSKNLDESMSKILYEVTKDDKIKRQAGGGDIINQVTDKNKQFSEIENDNNSHNKSANSSEDKNILIEKKDKPTKKNNNTTLIGNKNKLYSIEPIKNTSEKQCDNVKVSNSTLLSDRRAELDQDLLGEIDCYQLKNEIITITSTLTHVKEEICNLHEKIYEISKGKSDKDKKDHLKKHSILLNEMSEEKYFIIKQKQSNLKPSGHTESIDDVKTSLTNTIHTVEKRFQNFEEYVQCSLRNINDIITKNKNEEELIKYLDVLRLDFEDIKKIVLDLQQSTNLKDKQNEVLEEKLEVMKIIKADKDVVDEALMDKADICTLNKKVSHDQFDAVCDDLARSLNDVITKLSQQESIWQQSFYELRREIEGKLDELEIPALKDFINNEIQVLKNQFRQLSEVKREQEAAGAKKLLRNLRCISCDKDAFMQTNLKIITSSQPFPCRSSIKPYLTFKMDQVRDKKTILLQKKKNTNLEKFTSENSEKNKCGYLETYKHISKNDFSNRYCGGSHTIISPQEKVTTLQKRTRNCVMQSNVNNLQLVDGVVEGTDGRMYRGTWFYQ